MRLFRIILISSSLVVAFAQYGFRASYWLPTTTAIKGDWNPHGCSSGAAISTITDTASTPHDLSAAGSARPTCIVNVANGYSVARFDGVANVMQSTAFTQAQTNTAFMVVQNVAWANGARLLDSGTANRLTIAQTPNTIGNGTLGLYAGGGGFVPVNGGATIFSLGGRAKLIEAVFAGASSTLRINYNATQTANPGTDGIIGGVSVGAPGGGGSFFGAFDLVRLILADSTLTATNKLAIENYLINKYGIRADKAVTFDGDSLTTGLGLSSPSTENWPAQFITANPSYKNLNLAVVGQTCGTINTNFAAIQALQYSTLNSKNIYWLWCGTNDILAGQTAAQLETTLIAIAAAAHTAGLRVGFSNIIARSTLSAPQETERQTFNTWTRTNATTYFDAFVDLGSNASIGCTSTPANCYNNATYFQADGIHLKTAGYALVESLVNSSLLGL